MYQRVVFVGRLGSDPDSRHTVDGLLVARFSVAAESERTGKDGAQVKTLTWFAVTVFGDKAEKCSTLHKGDWFLSPARCRQTNKLDDRVSGRVQMARMVRLTMSWRIPFCL